MAAWAGIIAYRQSDSVHRRVRDELFDHATAMLEKDLLSVRISGVRRVRQLVSEDTRYYPDAKRLLCSFLRHPPNPVGGHTPSPTSPNSTIRPDLQSAAAFVLGWSRQSFELGSARSLGLCLHGASLTGLQYTDCYTLHADFSNARLDGAQLTRALLLSANFESANLKGANLTEATLSNSRFSGADLTGACLQGADLSSANLTNVQGLTQSQLDSAAHASTPPNLMQSLDNETNRQLVWHVEMERPTHFLMQMGGQG